MWLAVGEAARTAQFNTVFRQQDRCHSPLPTLLRSAIVLDSCIQTMSTTEEVWVGAEIGSIRFVLAFTKRARTSPRPRVREIVERRRIARLSNRYKHAHVLFLLIAHQKAIGLYAGDLCFIIRHYRPKLITSLSWPTKSRISGVHARLFLCRKTELTKTNCARSWRSVLCMCLQSLIECSCVVYTWRWKWWIESNVIIAFLYSATSFGTFASHKNLITEHVFKHRMIMRFFEFSNLLHLPSLFKYGMNVQNAVSENRGTREEHMNSRKLCAEQRPRTAQMSPNQVRKSRAHRSFAKADIWKVRLSTASKRPIMAYWGGRCVLVRVLCVMGEKSRCTFANA